MSKPDRIQLQHALAAYCRKACRSTPNAIYKPFKNPHDTYEALETLRETARMLCGTNDPERIIDFTEGDRWDMLFALRSKPETMHPAAAWFAAMAATGSMETDGFGCHITRAISCDRAPILIIIDLLRTLRANAKSLTHKWLCRLWHAALDDNPDQWDAAIKQYETKLTDPDDHFYNTKDQLFRKINEWEYSQDSFEDAVNRWQAASERLPPSARERMAQFLKKFEVQL